MAVFGMFPDIFNMILRSCCKPGTEVTYGLFLRSFREAEEYFQYNRFDFTFPVYGAHMRSTAYKEMPFVPIIQSPKVVLLTLDKITDLSKTHILLKTLVGAWPMVIFILLAASCSGTIMFLLDYIGSPNEDRTFFAGMWQGFWWAFVTMTTVGYGDHTPKTVPARIFCIMWIIIGISCTSLLTGMITASLTAKTQRYFNIHGAKIGAVNGSEEFKLGVTMFAKMEAYNNPANLFGFLKNGSLDGMLVDNYALSRFKSLIDNDASLQNIRMEKLINHAITYGLSMPRNSSKTERCFRTFLQDNQQSLFEVISQYLSPIKDKQDTQSYEVKAAVALFYQEDVFSIVVNGGLIFVGSAVIIGLIWEYGYRRRKDKFCVCLKRAKSGYQAVRTDDVNMIMLTDMPINACAASSSSAEVSRRELAEEFEGFQKRWIQEFESFEGLEEKIEEHEELVHLQEFDLETPV